LDSWWSVLPGWMPQRPERKLFSIQLAERSA
jgi:hypothetical protein